MNISYANLRYISKNSYLKTVIVGVKGLVNKDRKLPIMMLGSVCRNFGRALHSRICELYAILITFLNSLETKRRI